MGPQNILGCLGGMGQSQPGRCTSVGAFEWPLEVKAAVAEVAASSATLRSRVWGSSS